MYGHCSLRPVGGNQSLILRDCMARPYSGDAGSVPIIPLASSHVGMVEPCEA